MKKILGEWVLDIDLKILQKDVLNLLLHKPTPLQAGELRFSRKYFEKTTTTFGEVLGVSQATVIEWEADQLPASPMDVYIRMYTLNCLDAKNEDLPEKSFHSLLKI